MAKAKQEFVQHITPRDENFSQWYTDVVTQADLMDYTPVRGTMAMKPYGNRIWELIQAALNKRFMETRHENVAMPMLIPESLLLKEAEHVEGFAPEVGISQSLDHMGDLISAAIDGGTRLIVVGGGASGGRCPTLRA